ncbi:Ectonucleotide pyrophosphatase/phosphodiesterase family member 5 [Exaiptasia diaphana]|nr:Ectonucleotide pyrophosphatase/phosphodiesterase family member 5 [Exaiptasia diaphana]
MNGSVKRKQQVLLISLDGFRWDYMSKTSTPNLDYIVNTGVKAEFLRSAFPTTTYPNHITMVTGLYPESHGIIGNYMYDPKLRKRFDIYNTDPEWWHNAVPLWITNQNQGGRSGVIHWPGYNVPFNGEYADLKVDSPSYNIDLRNESGGVINYQERIDRLMEWFTCENPPNFVALYFEEPDDTGHLYGPNSPEIKKKIEKLDDTIGLILDRFRENSMLDSVNIIITSDHGMTEMSPFRRIFFDEYVDLNTFDIWDSSTNLMISPKKGHKKRVYRAFKQLERKIPHIKVYRKKDIPDFLHLKHNRRVPKIFVLADLGWALVKTDQKYFYKGNHGFSTEHKSMGGLFIGRGPAFREGYTREGLDNVHLYPLMCHLLGVHPRPNNGSLDETKDLLKPAFFERSLNILVK